MVKRQGSRSSTHGQMGGSGRGQGVAGVAPGLPHLPVYLQRSEASHARCSAKSHPTQLDHRATRAGPGTSPLPSPKPALPALRDGSHRETLAHRASIILPSPGSWPEFLMEEIAAARCFLP